MNPWQYEIKDFFGDENNTPRTIECIECVTPVCFTPVFGS